MQTIVQPADYDTSMQFATGINDTQENMLAQNVVQIPQEDDADEALKSQRLSVRSSADKKGPNYQQIDDLAGDIEGQRGHTIQGNTSYGGQFGKNNNSVLIDSSNDKGSKKSVLNSTGFKKQKTMLSQSKSN